MPLNFNQLHQQVSQIMLPINRLLVKKFSLPKKISYKAGGIDNLGTSVVTETDQQVEEILKSKLLKILPGSGFIGEETKPDIKDYNWIIDPIDGTLNFASQVPVFACSIALWHQDKPIYAHASLPLTGETLHAFSGQGLWLNNQPVKPVKKTTQKLFLTYSIVAPVAQTKIILNQIFQFTSSPRSFGSCVFHGANIALGRIDGGVFVNQAIWDIGAIVLLAREAGLTIKYLSPPPNLAKDDLKKYQYSLILGPEKLAHDLAAKLK